MEKERGGPGALLCAVHKRVLQTGIVSETEAAAVVTGSWERGGGKRLQPRLSPFPSIPPTLPLSFKRLCQLEKSRKRGRRGRKLESLESISARWGKVVFGYYLLLHS